jgi:hypothetical protein
MVNGGQGKTIKKRISLFAFNTQKCYNSKRCVARQEIIVNFQPNKMFLELYIKKET